MTIFIDMNRCCSTGLGLVIRKVDSWRGGNNSEIVNAQRAEREHLQACPLCNPRLQAAALTDQLWPGVEVSQ